MSLKKEIPDEAVYDEIDTSELDDEEPENETLDDDDEELSEDDTVIRRAWGYDD